MKLHGKTLQPLINYPQCQLELYYTMTRFRNHKGDLCVRIETIYFSILLIRTSECDIQLINSMINMGHEAGV
jgi:hypothetical protein